MCKELAGLCIFLIGAAVALGQLPPVGGSYGWGGGFWPGAGLGLPPAPLMVPPALWDRPPPAPPLPPVLGWPPPCQVLPPCNPPPPEMLSEETTGPATCAPLTDPLPGPALVQEHLPAAAPPRSGPSEPPGYRWYGSGEGLFLWLKRGTLPPLAASGPLGQPATVVLLDRPVFDDQQRWGSRGTLGYWLDGSQWFGLEATYLYLFDRHMGFVANSGENPALALPFRAAETGLEDAFFLGLPGLRSGQTAVEEISRLWSAEANLRLGLGRSAWHHLDLLLGFRALGFGETLTQSDQTQPLTGPATGTILTLTDRFRTRNLLLGGQLGAEGEVHFGRWFADFWGKMALCGNRQTVTISGLQSLSPVGGSANVLTASGFYAEPSNLGEHARDQISYLPEAGLQLGYQVAQHFRIYAGYEFLYLGNVVRPGDQIDRTLSLNQFHGGSGMQPVFAFHDTDAWVQGITLGLEFRY